MAKERQRDSQRNVAMHNGRANRSAIVPGEPLHHGVLPLFCALAEGDASHHRGDKNGKDQRADQRKGNRPRHRLEEPAFNRLQGEDGQIGGDDDAASKEDRPLHLMRRIANLLCRACARRPCSDR